MKLLSFFVICTMAAAHLFGDERGWNTPELAEAYHRHSEMQKEWAMTLIDRFAFQGDEHVLDFGCGDGKITASISRLVPNGSVTGYDVSHPMIEVAQNHYSAENLYFQTAPILGEYDLICSFSVLHFVDDPLTALIDLRTHLKPTGFLLLTIPSAPRPARVKILCELLQKHGINHSWNKRPIFTNELSIRSIEGCSRHLEKAGFEVLSIRIDDSPFLYQDVDAYINWLIGTGSPNWGVPISVSRLIYTDFVEQFLQLEPECMDSSGRIWERLPRLQVVAKAR